MDAVVEASFVASASSVAREASSAGAVVGMPGVDTGGVGVAFVKSEATFLHVRALGVGPGSGFSDKILRRRVPTLVGDQSGAVKGVTRS